MKAVNLIPRDGRSSGGVSAGRTVSWSHAVLGLLALAVVFVTIYVLTDNTIASRKAKLTALQAQLTQEQAQAARLDRYAKFVKLAEARLATVRQITSTRFDWHQALSDLSRVVPRDVSLQVLSATVAPGIGAGGTNGPGGSASVRGAIDSPAFELQGCTKTQDDVARLMSRLRLINDVTRVTLEDSQEPTQSEGSDSAASTPVTSGTGGSGGSCGNNAPSFDLVVFFRAIPGQSPLNPDAAAPGTTPTTTTTSSSSSTTTTASSSGSAQ